MCEQELDIQKDEKIVLTLKHINKVLSNKFILKETKAELNHIKDLINNSTDFDDY